MKARAQVASYTATDLRDSAGKALDEAARPRQARKNGPRSVEEMLRDYDRQKIARMTGAFRDDAPAGRELL